MFITVCVCVCVTECPTCGQYLKLLENTYVLQSENDRLRMENQRLEVRTSFNT